MLNSLIKTFEFDVGHVTNWNQVNVEFLLFVYLTSKKLMKVNKWNMQCINVICFRKFMTSYIHTIQINNEQHVIDYSTKSKRLCCLNSFFIVFFKKLCFST